MARERDAKEFLAAMTPKIMANAHMTGGLLNLQKNSVTVPVQTPVTTVGRDFAYLTSNINATSTSNMFIPIKLLLLWRYMYTNRRDFILRFG